MPPQTKSELRTLFREKRLTLATNEFHALNAELLVRVKQVDFRKFSTVHLFLPIQGNHEPDTYKIADWLKTTYPTIRLAISKSDASTRRMHHVCWDEQTVLQTNRWGIPEPQNGIPVLSNEIDAIFVPLLAFDKQGNRVGYGKGFYDRFLSECRTDAYKIGLSLFDATDAICDVDEYDVPLDTCITPERIWVF